MVDEELRLSMAPPFPFAVDAGTGKCVKLALVEVRKMTVTTTEEVADVAARLEVAVEIAWPLTYIEVESVGSVGSTDVEAFGYKGVVKILNPD